MPTLAEWAFGEMQYYEPPTHTLTQFDHQHKNLFMLTSAFSTLTSLMRPKLEWCRKVCGMGTKMLGNHQPSQGVTAQNWEGFQSVSYQLLGPLVAITTLCFGENFKLLEQLTGEGDEYSTWCFFIQDWCTQQILD